MNLDRSFLEVKTGTTRTVLLVGDLAFKFPRPTGLRTFINGILANMQEREFSRLEFPKLCPVVFSLPAGLMVVMPRTRPLDPREWSRSDLVDWIELNATRELVIPAEPKVDSFGYLDGIVVAVDYGN